jgi:hypothetical protein
MPSYRLSWVLLTFYLGWPPRSSLMIDEGYTCKITGVSHATCLVFALKFFGGLHKKQK